MLEERAYELRVSSDLCKLLENSRPQLFALLQRPFSFAGLNENPGAREQSPQGLVDADGRCSIAATSDGRDGSHVASQRQARTGPEAVTRLQRWIVVHC
jgi:hypothetical protein